jgi:hypothetical protein
MNDEVLWEIMERIADIAGSIQELYEELEILGYTISNLISEEYKNKKDEEYEIEYKKFKEAIENEDDKGNS